MIGTILYIDHFLLNIDLLLEDHALAKTDSCVEPESNQTSIISVSFLNSVHPQSHGHFAPSGINSFSGKFQTMHLNLFPKDF